MSTVVTIMDRHDWQANTDNIVLVEPARRRLLWVPRDLWCEGLRDRVNAAFKRGGHALLLEALAEHDLEASASLCIARKAVEAALAEVSITVPVPRRLAFWYPLHPTAALEDGRKQIVFEPPRETLEGERLHQWMGARFGVDQVASDFGRIARQKVLLRRLLEERFPFRKVIEDPQWIRWTGPGLLAELAEVEPTWRFDTFSDVEYRTIDGKMVLVDRRTHPALRWLRTRVRRMRRRLG
jgi:hypothetical protein